MFKKRIWFGIILSVIFLVFSINGSTAYYKYTQESGTNFYVGTDDKADALEDTNEIRQILDDLGNLLGHSKRDDLYPKNGTTGGYLGRLNYGLDASKPAVPVANDMYLATDTYKVYRCFVAPGWFEVYPPKVLGTLAADVNMGGHKLTNLSIPVSNGESVRTTATITEANLEDAVARRHIQNTDTQFDFYNALSSDHSCSGNYDSQTVGEDVTFGDLLYFDWTTKRWKKTDADLAANMPGLRIAIETRTSGQSCIMLVMGYIRDDAWDFTGAMVYTSATAGGVTSIAPSAAGQQLQRVGVAKSADILFFDPSIDVGEI